MTPAKNPQQDDIEKPEGPARFRDGHVQDRHLSTSAGAKLGHRVLTVFQRYAAQDDGNMLSGGDKRNSHGTRLAAGNDFASIYLRTLPGSKDSTVERIGGGSGGYGLIVNIDAKNLLKWLEVHMGSKNYKIVQLVCGEGEWPSEAISNTFDHKDYNKSVRFRFVEALDDLIDAFRASQAKISRFDTKVTDADERAEEWGE